MWEWLNDEFVLQDDTTIDIPKSIWSGLGQSEESLSYVLDDITPKNSLGDSGHQSTNSGDMSSSKRKEFADNTKDMEMCMINSSQVKRRRMLQYESEAVPVPYCSEEMPPTFLDDKEIEDTLEQAFSNFPQWVSGGGDTSSPGNKGLHYSPEGWLTKCFNDDEILFKSDDVVWSGASKAHNAGSFKTLPVTEASAVQKALPVLEASAVKKSLPVPEASAVQKAFPVLEASAVKKSLPVPEASAVQKRRSRSHQNVVFKGKKSLMQTPTKATSSVVYPFAFIKPCGLDGDMTLRDINQRICNPPKPKQKEDLSSIYPTSAFSGKPVVGQMKIHTEGGKGCITILRTKG
ncbi:hypothetical protein POM88_053202 [Heracleum sosnowskyi]|nr:hypothetical protein POM88_053202 [Heracleum sosnowskyi]